MRFHRFAVALCMATGLAAPAWAQLPRPSTGITIGATGGTLGFGPELAYRVNPMLAVRGSATFFGLSHDDGIAGYRYRGTLRLRNYGATVDLHPFLNGFRLSAGARVTDDNRIRFLGRARNTETFGPVTLTPEQQGTLSGEIRTRSVAPIATLGYSGGGIAGLRFSVDAGAMFHGRPRVEDLVATGRLATDPLVQARRVEQERRLRDEVDNYRIYPVLQFGIGWRF